MSTALIALKLTEKLPEIRADYIGADKGALTLAKAGKHMRLAVGDFDSVKPEDMELIRSHADEVLILNPVKDDTDSESALRHAIAMGYERIVMCGCLGGRADHSLVNLRLAYQYPGLLVLQDEQNQVMAYDKGVYTFPRDEWKYISFFTFGSAAITLENMKYPLTERELKADDLYTLSNEITADSGTLTVHSGRVLVIRSRDKE